MGNPRYRAEFNDDTGGSCVALRAEYETAAGHAPLFAMPLHSAVQITVRSSPTHGLERRLVRFLRLHKATLGLFSCLIPEGCGPDAAGFSGPYSSVLCHPFERHCCRPSALDTSTTALTALKSTSCSIMGLSEAIVDPSGRSAAHTSYRSLARTQSFQ